MFASQFENEEKNFENKKTAASVAGTLAVHAVILLLLIFSILHTPIPPFEDNAGGMTVNYGTDETGSGDIQPFTYNLGPTPTSSKAAAASQPEANTSEDAITEEHSDVVIPKTEDKPKPKVEKKALYKPNPKPVKSNSTSTAVNNAPEAPVQPKPNPNAMFAKGAYGKPNNSKGDGTGGPQGDQGKPDGDPNSRNYQGDGGNGNGPGRGDLSGGFGLKGRKIMYSPKPEKCSSTGKVVIAVKVDKSGKVIEATFRRFESTVFDECNKTNALNAARKATFNPDPNAPDVQVGTKTYIFKVE
ncbi:MAG: outer rane transport energization protein TonB [Bacteroidota bacterium]|nr:outer rane transport energization protein TonB [Bacteroidota bacterium]